MGTTRPKVIIVVNLTSQFDAPSFETGDHPILSLSAAQRAQMLVASREAAHAFVEDMVEVRRVVLAEGASIGEIRRLSGTLRRLLIERDLGKIAAPRIGRIAIMAPDNNPIYVLDDSNPTRLFVSGRVRVLGWSFGIVLCRKFPEAGNIANVPLENIKPPTFDEKREYLFDWTASCRNAYYAISANGLIEGQ